MNRAFASIFRACCAVLCLPLLLAFSGGADAASAGISANQSSFHTGDTLKLSATIGAGSDQGVSSDLYLSLRTPAGATLYLDSGLQWTGTTTPIASKLSLADLNAADFYSIVLPGSLPNGSYALQLVVVPAGGNPRDSASWLGNGSYSFSFDNQLSIQSLGSGTAQPGGVLTVTGIGFDPSASPSLRFSTASGYAVTVPAIAATSTSLSVPVPPLIDTDTGEFSSGNVSVQVTQAGGSQVSNNYSGLYLNALPSATNRPAGTLTLAFLKQSLAMAQQQKTTLPGSGRDNGQTAAALDSQLSVLPALISAVEQVMASPGSAPSWGSIYGHGLTLDSQALRNSDRLLLSMLTAQAQAGGFAGTGCAVQSQASALDQAYYASTGQNLDIGTYGNEYGNCTVDAAIDKGFNFVIGTGTVAVALMVVAGAPAYAIALPGAALLYLTISHASFDFSLASAFNDASKALDGLNKLIAVPIDMLSNSVLPETAGTAKDLYQGSQQIWDSMKSVPTAAPAPLSISGTWSGTWQWSGMGNNGCYFSDGGSLYLTITQTGSTFTGYNLSATGIETRQDNTCGLSYIDSVAGGNATGTLTNANVAITFNMPTVRYGNTLTFIGNGTLSGNTLQGTLSRASTGGNGSFSLTRQ